MGKLNTSGFLNAIPLGAHPSGCTRVIGWDKRVGHLNGLFFINVQSADFA